jgi:hypothetical protein
MLYNLNPDYFEKKNDRRKYQTTATIDFVSSVKGRTPTLPLVPFPLQIQSMVCPVYNKNPKKYIRVK